MRVVYTILAAAAESSTYENVCLLYNHSTCISFINGKYLSASEMLLLVNIYVPDTIQE